MDSLEELLDDGDGSGHASYLPSAASDAVSIAAAALVTMSRRNDSLAATAAAAVAANLSVVANPGPVRHLDPSTQALLTVFYLLGITGNIGALTILSRNETARNKRQTLMLKCLSWNDLLAVTGSAIQMHLQIYLPSAWVLTPYFCGVRVFWRAFGLGSGCVALAMAVERWLALTKPFVYQTKVTYRRIQSTIFGLWIVVTVLTCLPFFGFGLYYDKSQIGWKRCSRYRFGTTPEDIAYAYIWFGFGLTICVVIVACNLGVIEALYQMNRRSETRRLTRYPSAANNATDARSSLVGPTSNGLAAAASNGSATKNGSRSVVHHQLQQQQRQSIDADDASSYVSGSFHRHQVSVHRKRDSSVSSSNRLRHQPSMQTQEEIKFARLMAVLCIFYVLCWIPQLVAIPMGLSNPKHQERAFFRMADVCIALNFVLDPFIYVLLRGHCVRCCCSCKWCACFCCCWPCRKSPRRADGSVASQLAKDDAKMTDGLGYGAQTQSSALQGNSSQDRDYVPLKTLLADDSPAMADPREHPV